jgi:ketosteroid isomerase-like protein
MYETERVLRAAATAMTTGDMGGLSALFADDVVVHVPGTNQLSGDHKGKEAAFTAYMGKVMALTNGDFVFEPHDIAGSEDHAAGIYRYRATRDGTTLEWRHVNVYHVRDGQIVEIWQHPFDFERWNEFWS